MHCGLRIAYSRNTANKSQEFCHIFKNNAGFPFYVATNPDSIENFLKSLDPQLEKLGQPQQSQRGGNLEVRVMFAQSNGSCPVIVHLFALGRGISEKDLKGQLLSGQWTFKVTSMQDFCDLYEPYVFELAGESYHPEDGINYHRDPQESMPLPPDINVVSYSLVPCSDDQQGYRLLQVIRQATATFHRSNQ